MDEIIKEIIKLRDSRGWNKNDNPSSLAKSIFIESAELLENFQWSNVNFDLQSVKDEIADILMYTFALTYDLDIDVKKIIFDKIEKNKERYPKSSNLK